MLYMARSMSTRKAETKRPDADKAGTPPTPSDGEHELEQESVPSALDTPGAPAAAPPDPASNPASNLAPNPAMAPESAPRDLSSIALNELTDGELALELERLADLETPVKAAEAERVRIITEFEAATHQHRIKLGEASSAAQAAMMKSLKGHDRRRLLTAELKRREAGKK